MDQGPMDNHPIIICEECGQKYRVDTAKILGHAAGFSCRSCGHRIRVARPQTKLSDPVDDAIGQRPAPGPRLGPERSVHTEPPAWRPRRSGIGLRAKALWLLFIVPAGIAAAAGFLFLDQAGELVSAGHRETFFMLLLLAGGLILLALAFGLGFGLKLTGRIRRLAEAAECIVPVRSESRDDLVRIEAALARLAEIERPPDAVK